MELTNFQNPEIRDSNDNIIQNGVYGKYTAFCNNQNTGILDYINNNLMALKNGMSNVEVYWENIKLKPVEFPPSDHDHDFLYYRKSDVYTKAELDSLINTQGGYSRKEVNDLLSLKINISDVYTKEEADAKYLTAHQDISNKADKSTTLAGYGIADAYNKIEVNTLVDAKLDATNGVADNLIANDLIAYEKSYSGDDATVDLTKGHIQVLSSSSITLPALSSNGVTTLTLICTSNTVTWGGTIKWGGGSAPSFESGKHNIITFIGTNGAWYGSYAGAF